MVDDASDTLRDKDAREAYDEFTPPTGIDDEISGDTAATSADVMMDEPLAADVYADTPAAGTDDLTGESPIGEFAGGTGFTSTSPSGGFSNVDLGSAGGAGGSAAAGESTERMTQAAASLVDTARGAAWSQLDTRKQTGGATIQHMAHALRQTSQNLREQEQPLVAQVADRTAEQIERAGSYITSRDASEIVTDLERAARRQPLLLLAGGVAVGFALSRFMKTTPPTDDGASRDRMRTEPYLLEAGSTDAGA